MAQLIKVGAPPVDNVKVNFDRWKRLQNQTRAAYAALVEAEREAGYAMLAEQYPIGTKIYEVSRGLRSKTKYTDWEVVEWEVRASRYYETFYPQPRIQLKPINKDGSESGNRKRCWITVGEDGALNAGNVSYRKWSLTNDE